MNLPPLFGSHFPSFLKDSFQDKIDIYWYHPEFSQSRYPPGQETEAIVEGNATHDWIVKKALVPHPYLNTEEALKFGRKSLYVLKEWKFRIFHDDIGSSLYPNIMSFLYKWNADPKSDNLFMLLITCGRTILLIFQQQTFKVTLFDSHGHSTNEYPQRGLVVAQVDTDNLHILCNWYVNTVLHECYNAQANQYELAFLYPKNSLCECQGYYKNYTHDN
ncbi:uncharacterized protein LOC107263802 isoform X2 [Cephus cinctus]|uniref:Uncharacterized protein LOC107263802 isoform X2 n=1 Tax=Cephus cinctus TaxID=211228 RepID=A0AAJ7RAA3_CEPCN|nr:uncharacterized protein LOC107263802 isoform X2 [Cephus cinctus]